MKLSWWRRTAWTASIVVLVGVAVWLLSQGTRGAQIATVLGLPIAGLGLIVAVVALLRPGSKSATETVAANPFDEPPSGANRDHPIASADAGGAAATQPHPVRGRAMTKELFFLCGAPAPLHDTAAELRRAGYLVRRQPRDLDGVWSLQAYSAASELTDDDLATLDAIAERCGVSFDGWGTYVGPPEADDGPGKTPAAG